MKPQSQRAVSPSVASTHRNKKFSACLFAGAITLRELARLHLHCGADMADDVDPIGGASQFPTYAGAEAAALEAPFPDDNFTHV